MQDVCESEKEEVKRCINEMIYYLNERDDLDDDPWVGYHFLCIEKAVEYLKKAYLDEI